MTTKQLLILNSLVTYAAENVPGGLSEDERQVARIVGAAALTGREPIHGELTNEREYNYKVVDSPSYNLVAATANEWADKGWRVVAAIVRRGPEYGDRLILERPVDVSHPDD